jgi:predicted DsbA family dithiol-disulfide isomerase
VLTENATLKQIAQQDASVRQQGVTGVPFLVFNNKVSLSGAQPPEVMLDAMRKASD